MTKRAGPIKETIRFGRQKNIALRCSDPGGTLGKIKQPFPKSSKKLLLHQRVNHADACHDLKKRAAKVTFTLSKHRTQYIIYPPAKKIIGTRSIFARGKKSCVAYRLPFYTLLGSSILARSRLFWRVS